MTDYSSPRPWSYQTAPSRHGIGNRDWIEDAHGNVVVNNVGHLDGPLICRAVSIDLDKLFDLLILARNSKDEESLQEAIDMVAVASCENA